MEVEKEVDQTGWPVWQEVRQSKRIKATGTFHLNRADHAQGKLSQNKEDEGNLPIQQNSFAVLANTHIIELANKMGIQSESITFEKIDVLKDLEYARMKLNEHSSTDVEQTIVLEDENLPLEDHNVIEWGSEE